MTATSSPPTDANDHEFAAFISYRHRSLDRSWADWLHRALEAYRTPRDLVRKGVAPRIGRVFRDREELAASSDLSAEIRSALRRSENLIVICSELTPDSRWVNEEVQSFLELERGDRIFTVLVSGEPETSFPPALRAVSQGREPLAVDVRPGEQSGLRESRRVALLRIAAPMLGCKFDDLRRRAHERRIRRMRIAMMCTLALVGVLVGLVVWAQREEARATHAADLAEQRRVHADGLRLAAQADIERHNDTGLALNLALEGARRAPGAYTRSVLVRTLSNLHEVHTLDGHQGYVWNLAASPDGRHVAAPADAHYVTVWDVEKGVPVLRLDAHEGLVRDAAYSADGRFIATASIDRTARIWNAVDGSMVRVLAGHRAPLHSVRWTADGTHAVTAAADGTVRVWDVASGETTKTIRAFTEGGVTIAAEVSPDGARIAIMRGSVVRLFERGALAHEMTFKYPRAAVRRRAPVRLSFVAEGRQLLASRAERGANATIWDAESGEVVTTFSGDALVSRDGRRVVSARDDHTVIWDATQDRDVTRFPRVVGRLIGFAPEHGLIVTHHDYRARVWDARRGEEIAVLSGHYYGVHKAVIRDPNTIVTGSGDRTARVWRVRPPTERPRVLPRGSQPWIRDVCPGGTRAAITWRPRDTSFEIQLVEVPGGRRIADLTPGAEAAPDDRVAWSADGKLIAYRERTTNEVRLLRTSDGSTVWAVPAAPEPENGVDRGGVHDHTFSADGTELLEKRGTNVRVLDVATGEVLRVLPSMPDTTSTFKWSSDGKRLYSADMWAGSATEWDATTGKQLRVFGGLHTGWVVDALPNPEGTLLATTAADRRVALWDLETGKLAHVFDGFEMGDLFLRFSADGRYLAVTSASDDTRVFDVARREEFLRVPSRGRTVPEFVDDEIVVLGAEGEVRVVPMDVVAMARRARPRRITGQEFRHFDLGDDADRRVAVDAHLDSKWSLTKLASAALECLACGHTLRAAQLDERLRTLRPRGGESDVLRAAHLVRAGDTEGAYGALEAAATAGVDDSLLRRSDVFAPLRDQPRFQALVRKLRER